MKIFGSFLVFSSARHPVYNENDVGMSENSDGIMLDDDRKKVVRFLIQWGGGITGHLLFTPVMTHKSEVYRFYIFKINILAELVYLIIFCLFLLIKTY